MQLLYEIQINALVLAAAPAQSNPTERTRQTDLNQWFKAHLKGNEQTEEINAGITITFVLVFPVNCF